MKLKIFFMDRIKCLPELFNPAGRMIPATVILVVSGSLWLAGASDAVVLTNAVLRFEANDITGSDGDNISTWANTGTGGAGFNASASSLPRRPELDLYTLSDGVTTAKRLLFNGVSTGMDSSLALNQAGAITVYVVGQINVASTSLYQNYWSFDGSVGGWSRGIGNYQNGLAIQTKTPTSYLASGQAVGETRVLGVSYNGNDPQNIEFYSNGSTYAAPGNPYSATTNNNGFLNIGYLNMDPTFDQFLDGSIAALLVWDRVLNSSERAEVEQHLSSTYLVPEPAGFLLLGASAFVLVLGRRRG